MRIFISEGCSNLAKHIINNSLEWKQYEFNFTHEDNLSIYTGMGFFFYKINEHSCFGFFEKLHLKSAIKKSISNRLFLLTEKKLKEKQK